MQKQRKFYVGILLGILLIALCACQKEAVKPSTVLGKTQAQGCRTYGWDSFEEAYEEASAAALVEIGDWLGEADGGTFYKAKVLECYKGDLPDNFIVVMGGDSSKTVVGEPLMSAGERYLMFLMTVKDRAQAESLVEPDGSPYNTDPERTYELSTGYICQSKEMWHCMNYFFQAVEGKDGQNYVMDSRDWGCTMNLTDARKDGFTSRDYAAKVQEITAREGAEIRYNQMDKPIYAVSEIIRELQGQNR